MLPFLLVDDNHEILSFLKWELQEVGILSMQADNCQHAIEILKEIELKAIFLDIVLGHENSEKILSFLKSEENLKNKAIKVILMSGLIDESFSDKYRNKFFEILEKPFTSEELSQLILKLIK